MNNSPMRRLAAWGFVLVALSWTGQALAAAPLSMLVMDPLCKKLACACVEGYAQRDYDQLAAYLEKSIGGEIDLVYNDSMLNAIRDHKDQPFDIVIGKQSAVLTDCRMTRQAMKPIALLSDTTGSVNTHGLFVVRSDDLAISILELIGRKIAFGPADQAEKNGAAMDALHREGVYPADKPRISDNCTIGALEVVDGKVDAAVISSYAKPLLIGCGAIEKGALRVIGRTASVPFITLFTNEKMEPQTLDKLSDALSKVGDQPALCKVMESRDGFVMIAGLGDTTSGDGLTSARPGWTQFLGATRNAHSPDVPINLPNKPQFAWKSPLEGHGIGGIAANGRFVIVPDKSADNTEDVFHCFDADTGQLLWQLRNPAEKKLDYGNSPRATPLICDGKVYLYGALGHLLCVKLATGEVLWQIDTVKQFDAKLPTWGFCSSPVLVGKKLIVNPGGPEAAVVALDQETGKVIWQTPGNPGNYASPIVVKSGGMDQIILYDRHSEERSSLVAYRADSGQLLWQKVALDENYYVVPGPVMWKDKLITTTELMGAIVYDFDNEGTNIGKAIATSNFLLPTSVSSVVVGDRLYGFDDRLVCLKLDDDLKPAWETDDGLPYHHVSLFAGNDGLLVVTSTGELSLIDTTTDQYRQVDGLTLFPAEEVDQQAWSHPALVGKRLYLRWKGELYCVELRE